MTHATHIQIKDLHFPQPIKLAWQWTAPSLLKAPHIPSSECTFDVVPIARIEVSTIAQTPSDDHNISRILTQYGQRSNYSIDSSIVMHGFIRNLQAHAIFIVPTDIIKMCFLFYYEESNNSIHLAYRLYKQIHVDPVEHDRALSLLNTDDLYSKRRTNNTQLLKELIRFKFMRVVSKKNHVLSIGPLYECKRGRVQCIVHV
eukprot:884663_1